MISSQGNAIKHANDKINSNSTLRLIKDNAAWLALNNEKPASLSLVKYKEQQKSVRTTVGQNDKLVKLQQEMNVSSLSEDKNKFYNNPDKAKGQRYQDWLKALKTDLYIHETVGIVSDMATTANTAKK